MAAIQQTLTNLYLTSGNIKQGPARCTSELGSVQFAAQSWKGFSLPASLSHISTKLPNPLLLCSEVKALEGYLCQLEQEVSVLKAAAESVPLAKAVEDSTTLPTNGDENAGKILSTPDRISVLEKYQAKLAYSGPWMAQKQLEFLGKRLYQIEDEEIESHFQKLWNEYGLGSNPSEAEAVLFGKHPQKSANTKGDGEHNNSGARGTGMQRQGISQDPDYIAEEKAIAKRRDEMRKYDPRIRGPMRLAEQFAAVQKDSIKLAVFTVGPAHYQEIMTRLEASLDAGILPDFLPTEETISYQVNELMKNKKNQERIIKVMEALRQSEMKDEDMQEQKERVHRLAEKLHAVVKQVNQVHATSQQLLLASSKKRCKEGQGKSGDKGHKGSGKPPGVSGTSDKKGQSEVEIIELDELMSREEEPKQSVHSDSVQEVGAPLDVQLHPDAIQQAQLSGQTHQHEQPAESDLL